MKPALLIAVLLLLGAGASRGQSRQAVVPAPVTTYLGADNRPTTSPDSAVFRAETVYRDSVGGIYKLYYKSGALKQFAPCSDLRRRVLHGTLTTWYENGYMRSKEDYLNGKRHGDLQTFYPDGTLKRQDKYLNGRSGVGACYAPDGSPEAYFAYEQLPLYPGGDAALVKELAKGVNLDTKEHMAVQREGRVIHQSLKLAGGSYVNQVWNCEVQVELAVGVDGSITGARVVQSPSRSLNKAFIRSATTLKSKFVPARRDGQAVAALFTVPVSFTVRLPTESQRPVKRVPSNASSPQGIAERWGNP